MDTSKHQDNNAVELRSAQPACEKNDVRVPGILIFGAGLVAMAIAVHLLVWGLFYYLETQASDLQPAPVSRALGVRDLLPPEPRLQGLPGHAIHPMEELKEMRDQENQILSTYGWVDEKTGIVRIPIDEAMKLLLERGLPVRERK